jgi:hypothetical protein
LLAPECQCRACFRMRRSRHRLLRPLFYASWFYPPRWGRWFGLSAHNSGRFASALFKANDLNDAVIAMNGCVSPLFYCLYLLW